MAKSSHRRTPRRRAPLTLFLCVTLPLLAHAAPALSEDVLEAVPPRVSLVDGAVSFWGPEASDWEAVPLNLPLAPGDVLAGGTASRFELEIGARSFLRVAAHGELALDALENRLQRFRLNGGRATLDLRSIDPGSRLELGTPHATLALTAPGLYDVRVDPERSRFTAYEGSGATLLAPGGSVVLTPGFEIVTGPGFAQPARYDAPAADDWIHWNRERSERILAAASRAYVPEGIYGVRDLDDHGTWRDEPTYGRVWIPARVPATWAPYTTGRWIWHSGYGWTWVDAQPWGWAPFHYGRWVRLDSYWAWAPGPVAVRPVYAPALVAFLTPPVGVVVGSGPFVSWVALGWGEPVLPWWGPTRYRGRPCWRGWGGPTIVNEVYVHVDRRPFHPHKHKIERYRNQRFPDAVAGLPRRDFDRRAPERVRFRPEDRGRFRPGNDVLPPARRSFGPEERAGRRPPQPGIERGRSQFEPRGRTGERSGGERRFQDRPQDRPQNRPQARLDADRRGGGRIAGPDGAERRRGSEVGRDREVRRGDSGPGRGIERDAARLGVPAARRDTANSSVPAARRDAGNPRVPDVRRDAVGPREREARRDDSVSPREGAVRHDSVDPRQREVPREERNPGVARQRDAHAPQTAWSVPARDPRRADAAPQARRQPERRVQRSERAQPRDDGRSQRGEPRVARGVQAPSAQPRGFQAPRDRGGQAAVAPPPAAAGHPRQFREPPRAARPAVREPSRAMQRGSAPARPEVQRAQPQMRSANPGGAHRPRGGDRPSSPRAASGRGEHRGSR